MRRALLALPFALLPLLVAHAASPLEHASLGAHEHGTASLNAALDDQTLELELDTPAINLVGFEHPASTEADKATVAKVRALLEQPMPLFNLPVAAKCIVARQLLNSPLFGDPAQPDNDGDDDQDNTAPAPAAAQHEHEHSDIHAHYQFQCDNAQALKGLDLSRLFKTFPGTHKVNVQVIAPNGQQGLEATPDNAALTF